MDLDETNIFGTCFQCFALQQKIADAKHNRKRVIAALRAQNRSALGAKDLQQARGRLARARQRFRQHQALHEPLLDCEAEQAGD